jgi:hypothetical protein
MMGFSRIILECDEVGGGREVVEKYRTGKYLAIDGCTIDTDIFREMRAEIFLSPYIIASPTMMDR